MTEDEVTEVAEVLRPLWTMDLARVLEVLALVNRLWCDSAHLYDRSVWPATTFGDAARRYRRRLEADEAGADG